MGFLGEPVKILHSKKLIASNLGTTNAKYNYCMQDCNLHFIR
jgi:hypothetical protein